MSAPTPAPAPPPSQARRRTFFGLNAGVAGAAAVSAAILANWLVWWQYAAAPPAVKRCVRFDLSATRAHSLSPQTRRVLARLEKPVELVAVFQEGAGGKTADQAAGKTGDELAALRRRNLEDLLEEYARASRFVSTRVASASSAGGADAVGLEVAGRFHQETAPIRDCLVRALADLGALDKALAKAEPALAQVAAASFARERDQAQARTVANTVARLRQRIAAQTKEAQAGLLRPMPDYWRLQQAGDDLGVGAFTDLAACHRELTGPLYAGAPADAAGAVRQAADLLFKEARPLAQKVGDTLRQAAVPVAYEEARKALATGESLVVMGEGGARVVAGDRLFRRVSDALARAGAQATDTGSERFTGEEQVTGALIGLARAAAKAPPPRVVFLQGDAGYALDQETEGGVKPGLFQAMAARLRAMDFEVEEANAWSARSVDENGVPRNLRPAQPGQKTVWILCPFREPALKQAASISMESRAKSCAFLEKQLGKGDAALVLLNHDPLPDPERVKAAAQLLGQDASKGASNGASYETRHPIPALLRRHGIEAQIWQVLAHEEQEPGLQPVPVVPALVRHYPQDTDLGRAVEGLALRLEAPMPLAAALPLPAGMQAHELAALDLPRLYTLGFDALHGDGKRSFDPAAALPRAAVALATEDAKGVRVAAVGDPVWATDDKTTFGFHPDLAPASSGGAVGMATTPGGVAAWPGNAEFFVNAVCWLAHQDDLIAPGALSQDVRRIGPVSPEKAALLKWLLLAGLPGLAAATGIAVAARRRKFK